MFQNALARLEAQVQTVKVGVALLQLVHHAQALQVVLKTAKVSHASVQGVLPGVAKRCVPQVMGQGDGLNQVFIESQGARHGASKLRHLQRMR